MTISVPAGTLHERASAFTAQALAAYDRSSVYRDMSHVLLVATRGMIPIDVVNTWLSLGLPANQPCAGLVSERGKEVGAAYEQLFAEVTDTAASVAKFGAYSPGFLATRFAVTMEEDNILPGDGLLKLLSAIYTCPDCGGEVGAKVVDGELKPVTDDSWKCADCGADGYSAVSGLYWMKTEPPVPMAFGDPSEPLDFKPRRVVDAIRDESIIEVNGIAMGFAVWRKAVFSKISRPWFRTEDGTTQDIYFCKKARAEVGARFGVHCGVGVGHLNVQTGEIV